MAEPTKTEVLPPDGVKRAMDAIAAAYLAVKAADWSAADPLDKVNAMTMLDLALRKIEGAL